jgi:hypothetical protein
VDACRTNAGPDVFFRALAAVEGREAAMIA